MKASPAEIVYINGGEIYKAPTRYELFRKYKHDPDADPIFSSNKVDGKRYMITTEFKAFYQGGDGISLAGHNLAPAVDLWICKGAVSPDEVRNCDLFFAFNSTDQLRSVARHYGLPYPITDELGKEIERAPQNYCFLNAGGRSIVLGCVKFVDGKPAILKLYTYPKQHGAWSVWMYGASYMNGGQCWEKGAVWTMLTGGADIEGAQMRGQNSFRKAEKILTERADGVRTSYSYVRRGDPAIFWQGNELDADGNVVRVKRYESSDFVRRMIARMANGPTYTDRDLCPDVSHWLGRSWYDDSSEEELLFAVTGGAAQLERIAQYYGLPVPFGDQQLLILNSQPELYRARHYDVLGLGPGSYLPVIVGSVTFVDGKPERLLLYTFLRQWEFEEEIDLGLTHLPV